MIDRREFLKAFFVAPFAPLLRRLAPPKPVKSEENGLSIRLIRQYQPGTDLHMVRIDMLYGFGAYVPEMACRIES